LKLLGALLFRLRDGDQIRARPAAVNDLAGDALVAESEMASRFVEWRVDDRVLDDDLDHRAALRTVAEEGGFLPAARKSCASKPRLALLRFRVAGLSFSVSFVFARATVSFPRLGDILSSSDFIAVWNSVADTRSEK